MVGEAIQWAIHPYSVRKHTHFLLEYKGKGHSRLARGRQRDLVVNRVC